MATTAWRAHGVYPDATVAPPGGQTFPLALEPKLCTRFEVAAFARTAAELGVGHCAALPLRWTPPRRGRPARRASLGFVASYSS